MGSFHWGLCDPDATIGTTYRSGEGLDELVTALGDLIAVEAEETPEGFVPSGNVALYWGRIADVVPIEEDPVRVAAYRETLEKLRSVLAPLDSKIDFSLHVGTAGQMAADLTYLQRLFGEAGNAIEGVLRG